jgi:hypothetical protein
MQAIEIVPLKCTRCDSPLEAGLNEVIWSCQICRQGLYLDPQQGLVPIDIHYSKVRSKEGKYVWLPFWVAQGKVEITERQSYSRPSEPNPIWENERRFFLPAFEASLHMSVEFARRLIMHPIPIEDGPPQEYVEITVDKRDAQSLAEFVVLSIEAHRVDSLKSLEFNLNLGELELWIIPFGEGDIPAEFNREVDDFVSEAFEKGLRHLLKLAKPFTG